MGRSFYDTYAVARQTFEEADDALGFSMTRLIFDGPEDQLKLTEHTQPSILTVSVAVQRVLAEQGLTPAFAAGHSLGEYSAHVAAGTITFADAVRTDVPGLRAALERMLSGVVLADGGWCAQ